MSTPRWQQGSWLRKGFMYRDGTLTTPLVRYTVPSGPFKKSRAS
ncbi:hypothetical protein FOCG_12576 [Fusarium oxysporum f. sp. radicis-lycopersici 26381]|nr:hypothetical protein FOCG_12576 [Fusarium oxysporum f. sp. radicis-lycopersici 26381]